MSRNRNPLHSNFENLRLAGPHRRHGHHRSVFAATEQLTGRVWAKLDELRLLGLHGQSLRAG